MTKMYFMGHWYWDWDKMADILQMEIFIKLIILNENCCTLMQISLIFLPKGPINNKPSLVQIAAEHMYDAKPL